MTPSKASRSPIFSSVRFFQNSRTSLASPSSASRRWTWSRSSSSVMPPRASSVVAQSCRADTRSRSGGSGGPFFFFCCCCCSCCCCCADRRAADAEPDRRGFFFPCESTDTDESLPSALRTREMDRESVDVRREPVELTRCSEGRTSFFCFDAGNISSRSTGTPSETRNNRRMGDRIQSGGCNGGGAASWDQSDALRGLKKMGLSFGGEGSGGSSNTSGEYKAFK